MVSRTPNYNMVKPDQTDFYNADDFNGNIIDMELKKLNDAIGSGTSGDNILARLNKLEGYVGNLSNLETTEKANLVEAINEVRQKLMEHINNQQIHVTQELKDKWDNKLLESDTFISGAVEFNALEWNKVRQVGDVTNALNGPPAFYGVLICGGFIYYFYCIHL